MVRVIPYFPAQRALCRTNRLPLPKRLASTLRSRANLPSSFQRWHSFRTQSTIPRARNLDRKRDLCGGCGGRKGAGVREISPELSVRRGKHRKGQRHGRRRESRDSSRSYIRFLTAACLVIMKCVLVWIAHLQSCLQDRCV